MSGLVKDGFYKQVDHKVGDDKYALLGAGGHKEWSTSSTASTLVARDANKDIYIRYAYATLFNSSTGDLGTTAFDRVYVSNDSFIRYVSTAQFKTGLFGSQVGSPSVPIYWTGSAFATCIVSFGNSSYGEHNANNITDNGLKYYSSNGPSTSIGASTGDGALYSQAYSTSWVGQIAQDYRNGGLFVRGKNNGTWKEWRAVLDTGHIGLVATDGKFEINPHTRTIKTIKTDSAWNAQVYSTDGYIDNVYVEFKASQTNAYIMVGLNSDPTTDANYSSLDYCWYIQTGANLCMFENNGSISSIAGHTSYAVNDEFRIEYSGGYVRYYHNGVICRVVARAIGSKLYFDSSFHNAGAIYDVKFGLIGASNILYFNRNTDISNWNTVNTESYIATVGLTGGAPTTLTKPTGTDNAFGVIHMHLHSGNYSMQLGFGGTTGHMYFRNAYNTSTFGNWITILDSTNWTGIVDGRYLPLAGGTMTGTIERTYSASNQTPFIHIDSGNYDNYIWQIGSGTTTNQYYGYGLKYIGTGSDIANYLRLYADNQNGTDVIAIGINQSGQVGIGTDANNNYRLYVNGNSYFSSDSHINGYVGIGRAPASSGLGRLVFPVNEVAINFRADHDSYYSKVQYMTSGNEALVFTNKNAVTSFIFKCGYDMGNGSNWYSTNIGTPSIQIKKQSLYVNTAIAHDVNPAYNFYVTGSSCFTGQITSTVANGTAPFIITSETLVSHLNADLLDGYHATDLCIEIIDLRKYT